MRFNFALIFNFLFASAVLADRTLEHRTKLLEDVDQTTASNPPNITNVLHQAGGMVTLHRGTILNVSALFAVPLMENLPDAGVFISVNIDGEYPFCTSLFSAGVAIHVSKDGPAYQPYMASSTDTRGYFSNNSSIIYSVSSGDLMKVMLSLTNETFGHVQINNYSKGATHVWQGTIDQPLCRQSAKWVTTVDPRWTPPSTYGNVTFTLPQVYDIHENVYGPQNARMIFNMLDDHDKVVANVMYDDVSILISPRPVE